MAAVRPVVNVFDASKPSVKAGTAKAADVIGAPLRPEVVRFVFTNMSKNKRQAYANMDESGYGTAAASWGTGRAVARIPRVPGGGTHRSGQAAFGNMCRGGGMFAPTKIWRRWHRKVNVTMKRHAVASAVAASALPALVMARGHSVENVPEMPLVVSNGLESMGKTKEARAVLLGLGLGDDLKRVEDSKTQRAGRGKMRNRRFTQRLGPLVVFEKDEGVVRAMRAIAGVDTCSVSKLNLLQLAPGGTFGRMIVWTQGAFEALKAEYGSYKEASTVRKGYRLPRPAMTNADVAKIINSDEVQSIVNAPKTGSVKKVQLRNPLKSVAAMRALNPTSQRLCKTFTKPGTKPGAKGASKVKK